MNPELIAKAQELERESQQAEETLRFVDEKIAELEGFSKILNDFEASKDKEMLSSIGSGVYAKTELKEKELFVNVGAGVLVKKTPKQAQEVVQSQIKTLAEARAQIVAQLESYTGYFMELMREVEKEKASQNHSKN
jgi:prefoldin alpha subunit